MRIIDLSVTVGPNLAEPVPVEIERISHEQGADILGGGAGVSRDDFPDKMAISQEHVRLTTHTGTHVDAPHHYGPWCEGRPARTIDQMPLDWFVGPGVLLDCRSDSSDPVSADEIRAELERIGHKLVRGEIVLVHTGADELWDTPEYFTSFRGMSREATAYLVEAGIRVIGIDSFGFDAPFGRMLQRYSESRDPAELWPAHLYGREHEYCQIERLAGLSQLPSPTGFTVSCLPVKVHQAGAGWCRAVAIYEELS